MLRKILMVFSALMAAVAAGLLAWANWPVHMVTRTNQLHLVAPDSWGVEEVRQIQEIRFDYTLIFPAAMKAGQSARYQAILTGLPESIDAAGQTWQLHIHSELFLPGFLNLSEGTISQSAQADEPLQTTWDVKALDERRAEGALRTYVEYVSDLEKVDPQLLSVVDLPLVSTSLLGQSTAGINSLAIAILLLAGLAGSLGLTRPRD
jgi:hypothetical protein